MRTLFLFLLLLSLNAAHAQNPQLAWAKGIAPTISYGDEDGRKMAIDAQGNVYTSGDFLGTVDFDPGVGVFNMTSGTIYRNTYVQKLDAAGNFVWARALTGLASVFVSGIAIDAAGAVLLTGNFDSTADFDPGTALFPLVANPSFYTYRFGGQSFVFRASSSFICKLNTAGDFVWAKKFDNTEAVSVATDAMGNVYAAGYFILPADFDPGPGTATLTPPGLTPPIFVLSS